MGVKVCNTIKKYVIKTSLVSRSSNNKVEKQRDLRNIQNFISILLCR